MNQGGKSLLDPCGGKSVDKYRMSPESPKQGKAGLRYALFQAATIASYKDAAIRNYFTRLLKGWELERGIKMKMRIKLAAKLLVIAWTLMKRNEAFDPGCFKS